MRRRLGFLTAIALCAFLLPVPPALPAGEEDEPDRFSVPEREVLDKALRVERELVKLVESVRPSSVTIENWQARGKGNVVPAGQGSGVIISSKGHILTNEHVVKGAAEIWVVLYDHRRFKAILIGNDPRGDVALLKIDAKKIRPTDPRRARPERLSAGDWVIATGNPFGLAGDGEPVVTLGVVSGLGRVMPGQFFYGDAVQHDAKINPGNSGGPLWDSQGDLLGLNGKIAVNPGLGLTSPSSSGAGYTIPINQIRNFLEAMFDGTPVRHGDEILGVEETKTHYDEDGTSAGAEVVRVRAGSPAFGARSGGVQAGDIIVKVTIGGKSTIVRTMTDFISKVSPLAEGSTVGFVVERGRRRVVIPGIKLEEKKPPKGERKDR